MASGQPDWLKVVGLMGQDPDGNIVLIQVDADGQLTIPLKGLNPSDDLVTVAVDADGQLYSIMRGASGADLLVDSDGFLSAVLKGVLNGTLTTVAVDAQGYLAAYMLDDESQWGDTIKVGNAELAARLGSLTAWDWRGQVVYQNDFRYGLGGMYTETGGTGAAVGIDTAVFYAGGYSLKLTGGSTTPWSCGFGVAIDIPPTPRVGVMFRWTSDVTFDYLELKLRLLDGTKAHDGNIRIDLDNQKLEYYSDTPAYVELGDYKPYNLKHVWHNIKLVIDTTAETYIRCLAGNTEHDMSALSLYSNANAGSPRLEVITKLYSHDTENEYAWIDSLIITVGEPT